MSKTASEILREAVRKAADITTIPDKAGIERIAALTPSEIEAEVPKGFTWNNHPNQQRATAKTQVKKECETGELTSNRGGGGKKSAGKTVTKPKTQKQSQAKRAKRRGDNSINVMVSSQMFALQLIDENNLSVEQIKELGDTFHKIAEFAGDDKMLNTTLQIAQLLDPFSF